MRGNRIRNISAIALKEMRSYFSSPVAYIVTAVFLAISGFFFASSLSNQFPEATIRGFLTPASYTLILLAPVLTMRLLAEEQKLGTIEILFTTPIHDRELVLGKYLASIAILLAMLALTIYYPIILFWLASPDPMPIVTGYLGFFLLGAAALSVGLFTSSLTGNQIVAAVLSMGILTLLWALQTAADFTEGPAQMLISYISLGTHLRDLASGVIDTRDIVHLFTMIGLFLFLTVRSVETRRWR